MSQSALNQEIADLKLTLQQTQQGIIYTLSITVTDNTDNFKISDLIRKLFNGYFLK